jgi:hypothetical protein
MLCRAPIDWQTDRPRPLGCKTTAILSVEDLPPLQENLHDVDPTQEANPAIAI